MKTQLKQKIIALLWRYIPAEVCAIVAAYLGFFVISHWDTSPVVTAYASSIGESIGYYFIIITRELLHGRKTIIASNQSPLKFFLVKLLHILLEFGPAELLDSLVFRPLFMGIGIHYMGPGLGIVAGKLMSDVFFYTPVIISYELRKRFYHRMAERRSKKNE